MGRASRFERGPANGWNRRDLDVRPSPRRRTVCPPPLLFKLVVSKGRFGSASGRWSDLSPIQPTVEANRCRYSETVLPGRLRTAMIV
jgi:hypothetical protein